MSRLSRHGEQYSLSVTKLETACEVDKPVLGVPREQCLLAAFLIQIWRATLAKSFSVPLSLDFLLQKRRLTADPHPQGRAERRCKVRRQVE